MFRSSLLLMLAGLMAFTGCERKSADSVPGGVTTEDVRRETGEAIDTAVEFSQQAKETFQKNLEAKINELDGQIVALREKGRDLTGEAKTNWDQKMTELEAKRDVARARLAEVGQSTASAWNDVKQGAQAAWDDLNEAVLKASREF